MSAQRGRPSKGRRRGAGAKAKARSRGESHSARVAEVTPTGDGVAVLSDGRRVFVPGVAAGELVRLRLEPGAKAARARLEEVLEPAVARVDPPCAVASRCGGCDWMHIAEGARHALYLRHVHDQIARAGPWDSVVEPVLHTPLSPLGYRQRARLFVKAHARGAHIGYRASRSHRLTEVDSCPVLRAELEPVLAELVACVRGSDGSGEAQASLGRAGKRVVELRWRGTLDAACFAQVDQHVRSGLWAGARIWAEDAAAPATFGDPEPLVAVDDGEPLRIAAGGFAQVSDAGGRALADCVGRLVAPTDALLSRIVELFAGSGTLSVVLAPLAERFVAVEQDAAAAAQLRSNLRDRGLSGKLHVADANSFAIPRPTDCVVLDPPRGGAPGAMEAIVRARPQRVVYVSCNAATLARDAAVLGAAKYRIERLSLFELFPQTSHVETVAHLLRS